jgi:predicted transcriptional regulator/DNA-binding XRE family transcriptional regulator
MNQDTRRKIFAGGRVRKLRGELELSQQAMAGELGISLSYLNLIERNQRPLTAQLLIRLSESYGIDPRAFAQEEDFRASAELEEIFSDPLFQQSPIPKREIKSLAEEAPDLSKSIKQLYQAYVELRDTQMSAAKPNPKAKDGEDALEQVRIFLERSNNYFPSLEVKAEALGNELQAPHGFLYEFLAQRLRAQHGIKVQIMRAEDMQKLQRHYDRHRKKLLIAESCAPAARTFHVAYQLGVLECATELDKLSLGAGPLDSTSQKLARINLCNYFAAAVIMPYVAFHETATTHAYDLEILRVRFSASTEQVAHRLTTLARPNLRGIPFFMLRIDAAGQVSKRLSISGFALSRFGGTCGRWNIHHAQQSVLSDIVEMPDGTRWFSIAKRISHNTIILGCEFKHAKQLIYAQGLDLKSPTATPIGINCKLCERQDCKRRSAPPYMRKLHVNENSKGFAPF